MAERIIVLFNLKPGVTLEEYETFALTRDKPVVDKLPSIDGFEIYRTTGVMGSTAAAPYQYIEVVDISDMDQFAKDIANAEMEDIVATFAGMADAVFITTQALK